MPRFRRAHDVVGAGVQHLAHRLEFGRDAIDKLLRRHPLARSRLLDLQAMLIHAGDEESVAPVETHEPLDRIGRDALVSMADMRRAIGVRDRRGDVEAAHERRPKAKVFERRRKSVRNSSPMVGLRHPHPEGSAKHGVSKDDPGGSAGGALWSALRDASPCGAAPQHEGLG